MPNKKYLFRSQLDFVLRRWNMSVPVEFQVNLFFILKTNIESIIKQYLISGSTRYTLLDLRKINSILMSFSISLLHRCRSFHVSARNVYFMMSIYQEHEYVIFVDFLISYIDRARVYRYTEAQQTSLNINSLTMTSLT